jgi:hypothetical protein
MASPDVAIGDDLFCSPAKAGAQDAARQRFLLWRIAGKRFALLDPGLRRGTAVMKPINAWPLIILLVAVLFLLAWFGGYLR